MNFDDEAADWVVTTEAGQTFRAPFVVAATGILSAPLEPDIAGITTFAGTSVFTSRWPKEGIDLVGKRVGVIGTGSSGVQLIPVVAREAAQLYVFQRSPAYTLPWQVRPFAAGELDEMKAQYDDIRAAQRPSRRCPPRSRSGSTTPPRWSRRRCWSTRRATPGTTVAMCPARNGCTWAIPAESPNTGGAAMKSRPADTPVSSWRR